MFNFDVSELATPICYEVKTNIAQRYKKKPPVRTNRTDNFTSLQKMYLYIYINVIINVKIETLFIIDNNVTRYRRECLKTRIYTEYY